MFIDEDPDENEIENGNVLELAKMLIDMACRYRGQADKLTADHEKVHSAHIMQRRAILTWRARYDAEVQQRRAAEEHIEVLEAAIREAGGTPAERVEKKVEERPFTDQELDAEARKAEETDRHQAYEKIRDQSEQIRRLRVRLREEEAETASHSVQCEVLADTGSVSTQTETWEPNDYQCEINTLNEDVSRLREEVANYRASLQELEELKTAHEQQTAQLAETTGSLETKTAQVTEKDREIRRLNSHNGQLEEQFKAQSEDLVDLKIKLSRNQVQEEFGVMVEMPPERWQALLNTCVNELQSYKKHKAQMRERILELENLSGAEKRPDITREDKKPLSAESSEQCKEGADRIAQLEEELLLAYASITKLESKREEIATKYQQVMNRFQELQSNVNPGAVITEAVLIDAPEGDKRKDANDCQSKDDEKTGNKDGHKNKESDDNTNTSGVDNSDRINQLQTELESLRGVTDELRQAAAAQTESVENLTSRLRESEQALEERQREATRLQEQLQTMTEERNSFKSQYKDEKDKSSALSILLVSMKADTVAQANRMQTLAGELAASRLDKREELMFQINRLNDQLDELRKKLKKESDKTEKLESDLTTKTEEVESHQQRVADLTTENITLNNRVGFLEAQVNDMTAENSELVRQKTELETERDDTATRIQDLEMLRKTDSNQQEELGAFAESLRREMKEANERAQQSEAEVRVLQGKIKEFQDCHLSTTKSLDEANSHISDLEQSKQAKEMECEKVCEESVKLKKKVEELETLLTSKEEHISQLTTDFEATSSEINIAKQQLHESTDLYRVSKDDAERLQVEIKEKDSMIAELSVTVEQRENETKNLTEQIELLKTKSESQGTESASLLDELKKRTTQLEGELDAIRSENSELKEECKSHSDGAEKLSNALSTSEAELRELRLTTSEQIKKLEEDLKLVTMERDEALNQLKTLEAQLKGSTIQLEEITAAVNNHNVQSESLRQEMETLKGKMEEKEAEIARLVSQSETQQSEIDRLSTQNTELQREVENTRREVMESSMTSQSSAVSEVCSPASSYCLLCLTNCNCPWITLPWLHITIMHKIGKSCCILEGPKRRKVLWSKTRMQYSCHIAMINKA